MSRFPLFSVAAVALFSLSGLPARAQSWTQLNPTTSPPALLGQGMTSTITQGRVLMFGGYIGNIEYNETWEWDGRDWQQIQPAISPPVRRFSGLSFDVRRQRAVLFAGQANSVRNDETWEYFGGNWSRATPGLSPAPRHGHGQDYDWLRGETVVFSGLGNNSYENNTWVYDGTTWRMASSSGPAGRIYPAMAYDQRRMVMVLFGGYASGMTPPTLDDTWEWDGTSWTQVVTRTTPTERWGAAMCYDIRSGRIVMHGGSLGSNETWVYDGVDWTLLSPLMPEPNGRYRHGIAFDFVNQSSLLFGGGTTETWAFSTATLPSYLSFGTGCAGTGGVPRLVAGTGSLPWINTTFMVEVNGVPGNGAAILAFGLSNSNWGPIPLPLVLGGLGLTGCELLVSGESFLAMTTSAGLGRLSLPVPNDMFLVGRSFFNQAIVFDPGANPAGLTMSNGATALVGRK